MDITDLPHGAELQEALTRFAAAKFNLEVMLMDGSEGILALALAELRQAATDVAERAAITMRGYGQ